MAAERVGSCTPRLPPDCGVPPSSVVGSVVDPVVGSAVGSAVDSSGGELTVVEAFDELADESADDPSSPPHAAVNPNATMSAAERRIQVIRTMPPSSHDAIRQSL